MLFPLAACVVVPYTPTAKSVRSTCPAEFEGEIYLTIGPRTFLDQLEAAIKDEAPDAVFVDRLLFRDALFPDGGWTLRQLLGREAGCGSGSPQADYLVLIGRPQYAKSHEKGGVVFYLGFFGAAKSETTGELSALIIDLKDCRPVTIVTARAEGGGVRCRPLLWPVYLPQDRQERPRLFRAGVAEALRELGPRRGLRIALMAAESKESQNFLNRPLKPGG
jgi:hypothetical protein